MNNQDLYKAARGYWTANAVVGSAASKMAQLNREQEAKIAEITSFYSHYQSEKQLADRIGTYIVCNDLVGAYEFLNRALKNEIIHDCQNQKEFTTHLSELIEQRKDKYRPFYQKIDMSMPVTIEDMTAEDICSIMSVELMSPAELKQYHSEKEAEEWADKLVENLGIAFRAVLIIGLIVLMIFLSAQ